ncbi:MAG: flagellar basal body rod protein FlgC [Gammaproteobacteria bacterium]|nr:flagellar basal body rod protein FlgC [Gammaproteobacteria bacterium]MDH5731320.1 flagellar basal body rod protein FlgC [Gammaproteobacteria bacterium]
MSLLGVFDVSGSALSAQSVRLNITASNLANAETVSSSIENTYRARNPIFATQLDMFRDNPSRAGVQIKAIVESQAELRMRYEPENPMANEQGYIFLPNVNTIEEMANMISASRSYQNNVEAMNTSKQLLMATLRLGQ